MEAGTSNGLFYTVFPQLAPKGRKKGKNEQLHGGMGSQDEIRNYIQVSTGRGFQARGSK